MTDTYLIIGADGQDGRILNNILLGKKHNVYKLGRRENQESCEVKKSQYIKCDLRDGKHLSQVLIDIKPDKIYYLAAIHGSAGFEYEKEWDSLWDVNVRGVHIVLDYIRRYNQEATLIFASSLKVFEEPVEGIISEQSLKSGKSLYAISKLAAESVIEHYRLFHRVDGRIIYYFNHESILRPGSYFISKVTDAVIGALADPLFKTNIYSFDFYADWGCAKEYMELTQNYSEMEFRQNVIIATGSTIFARDLVNELFTSYGLDYRNHFIEENPHLGGKYYSADIHQLQKIIGKVPQSTAFEIFKDVVEQKRVGDGCH